VSKDFKDSLDIDNIGGIPKDLGKSRRLLDERNVNSCKETISLWNNPFNQSKDIVSLSSGIAAPIDIKKDLLNASSIGDRQLKDFIASRVESSNVNFYDSIKKNKLKTS